MKRARWISQVAVVLATVGTALPQAARAAAPVAERVALPVKTTGELQPPAAAFSPLDIALGEGGRLEGQVLNAQGTPQAGVPVVIRQQDRVVATTRTDGQGHFAVTGLGGGLYQVVASDGAVVCRCWAPHTAPPAAQSAALVVSGQEVLRGQFSARYFLTNPWVLAGLLGAAIAVPIALSNTGKSSAS